MLNVILKVLTVFHFIDVKIITDINAEHTMHQRFYLLTNNNNLYHEKSPVVTPHALN